MPLNPRRVGFAAVTSQEFIDAFPKTAQWDPHRELIERLTRFPWHEELRCVWYNEPTLYAATTRKARPYLHFELYLSHRHLGPYWQAFCCIDSTVLECSTGDIETLFYFFGRLPLSELRVHYG